MLADEAPGHSDPEEFAGPAKNKPLSEVTGQPPPPPPLLPAREKDEEAGPRNAAKEETDHREVREEDEEEGDAGGGGVSDRCAPDAPGNGQSLRESVFPEAEEEDWGQLGVKAVNQSEPSAVSLGTTGSGPLPQER